jgi:hypothetical protein
MRRTEELRISARAISTIGELFDELRDEPDRDGN